MDLETGRGPPFRTGAGRTGRWRHEAAVQPVQNNFVRKGSLCKYWFIVNHLPIEQWYHSEKIIIKGEHLSCGGSNIIVR